MTVTPALSTCGTLPGVNAGINLALAALDFKKTNLAACKLNAVGAHLMRS